ncbi:hypothetical protein ACPOL_4049 [Acidisarcina polymorpha]|uniref:Uncharacterized protein n=1 Tax=Acidisarcina polymorpha TaxID=2211140 RepID=A0A2Z5G2K9_9BACT|nr:hypothetical protein ACPOL_4049 [Acidisarcina polymorpha]
MAKKTDAYARTLGDCIGGPTLKTAPLQNAISSCVENSIHRLGSARLSGRWF